MPVRVERNGGVTTVVLSRPEVRNAVDREHAQALADAFRAFDADASAHAGVLWGEHGTFCAGADLKAIAEGRGNRMEPEGDAPMGLSRLTLSKPVVAGIAGHAVGGGLELALWCDLRVVEEGASLGFLNRRFGVPLVDGGTVRLPRVVGMGRALDLVLTGRVVTRRKPSRWGWSAEWWPQARRAPRRRSSRSLWPRSRSRRCATTASPSTSRRVFPSTRPCAQSSGTAWTRWPRARSRARGGSRADKDGTEARPDATEERREGVVSSRVLPGVPR
jgi:enoyl-CoA hydratase/carnithine racemase